MRNGLGEILKIKCEKNAKDINLYIDGYKSRINYITSKRTDWH